MHNKFLKFRRDEQGSVSIGLLFAVPILVWVLLSTFVFFDAFRAETISQRAGLTLADMFSRERDPITPEYLDNAHNLLRAVTTFDADPDFRVTAYQYFEDDDELQVIWSETRGDELRGKAFASDGAFAPLRSRLPDLDDGEISLLVETISEYRAPLRQSIPGFKIREIDELRFGSFVFISPRWTQVCFQENSSVDPTCDRFSS